MSKVSSSSSPAPSNSSQDASASTHNNSNNNMTMKRVFFLSVSLCLLAAVAAGRTWNPFSVILAVMNNKSNPTTAAAAAEGPPAGTPPPPAGPAKDAYLVKDTIPPPHFQTHPLLQLPCAIQLVIDDEEESIYAEERISPLTTFVDTGAQVSVLSMEAASRAGVLHMLDRRYAGHALGVGKCRVLGRLPAGVLYVHLHGNHVVKSPAFTILEHTNDGVDLLLGLDFLRDHGAILNLRSEEMTLSIKGRGEVSIPFIRPRATLNFGDTTEHDHDEHDSEYDCYDHRLCSENAESDEEGLDMSGV